MTLFSSLIFLPLAASILVLLLPERKDIFYRYLGVGVSLYLLVVILWFISKGTEILEVKKWFSLEVGPDNILEVNYILGADGLSFSMLLLSGIVFLVASTSSFGIKKQVKSYYAFYLLLMSSVMGCFMALDFFLFFLFFEFMLLPMYFLIGIWGGKNREYAALKFLLYTLFGSVLILIVLFVVGFEGGTLDLLKLKSVEIQLANSEVFGISLPVLLFFLLLIGFGIKLPTVPVHTWLPDAHVEAPTAISVVLAGVLLKIGAYGFIRIGMGLFPTTVYDYRLWIASLGVLSIIYGAFNALAQKDLKKLIAYSSVSHMGFVFIGLASFKAAGLSGAVFQLFSHGLLSSMLFLIAGVIYDRTQNRWIENYRGLAGQMPKFTAVVVIAFFGSMGLPGLSGFIGEFFTLMGSFQDAETSKWIPFLATLGIVLAAAYLLWTLQKMFFGSFWVNKFTEKDMPDLSVSEGLMLYGLSILVVLFGLLPSLLFDILGPTLNAFVQLP